MGRRQRGEGSEGYLDIAGTEDSPTCHMMHDVAISLNYTFYRISRDSRGEGGAVSVGRLEVAGTENAYGREQPN